MSVSDDFNRANSGSLGANWTTISAGGCQIVSNTCRGVTSGQYNWSVWSANSFNSDQSSQVTLAVDCVDVGPIVRVSNSAGIDGYFGMAAEGSNLRRIYRRDNGGFTVLASNDGAVDDLDVIKLEAVGTTLNYYQNGGGALITTTDATYSTGNPGVSVVGDSTVGGVDDWIGTGEISDSPYQVLKLSGVGNNLASPGFLLRP